MTAPGMTWRTIALLVVGLAALSSVPYCLGRFYVYLLSLIFCMGLLATSLNLCLGFGGMFQFHHAVFFGMGAYGCALMLTKTSLPSILAMVTGSAAAAILALIMGIICVRLSKLYFGMLQLSLGSLVWAVVYRWYSFTGGDDGIRGIVLPEVISSVNGAYYFALSVTCVSLVIMYRIIHSPFGLVLQAVRDNPERSQGIGVNVQAHRLAAQVCAGAFAGIAGVLFVVVEGAVFPDLMFWNLSLELIIMCLLGGWFTFWGPMLGAAFIPALRSFVGAYTDYWTSVLAVILMLLIFFLPDGILGYLNKPGSEPSGSSGGEPS